MLVITRQTCDLPFCSMLILFLVKLFWGWGGFLILKSTFVVCLHLGRQVQKALKENFTGPQTSAVK